MKNNNVQMQVLIKGKPIVEYAHNGQILVEGRHNSSFEIELTNHNHFPVEVIVSVDGLSVTDGKDAGPNSSGYMLKAREVLRIPGWKLSNEAVAAFEFAGKGVRQSYAEQTTGSARNTGVIGFLAYKEKPKPYQPNITSVTLFSQQPPYNGSIAGGLTGLGMNTMGLSNSNSFSDAGIALCAGNVSDSFAVDSFPNASSLINQTGAIGAVISNNITLTSSINQATASAASTGAWIAGDQERSVLRSARATAKAPEPQNNLGTAFGKQKDFATETVTFERGDLLAMSVIYYDDARGLKARGIVLERRSTYRRSDTPDAFPAMNCQPPAGWKG